MRKILAVVFATITFSSIFSQSILPRYMTEDERKIVNSGEYNIPPSSLTPPPGEVRIPAEWEEMQSVIITWQGFSSILGDIVEALKDEVEVIIVCDDENVVKNSLTNQNIDFSTNVSFYELPSNSIWVRDYGPNSAYLKETGELVWIDWIYNRPRYKDDQVPVLLGQELGIQVYESATAPQDLVNTGGNFMSDGLGTGFSSRLVLDENGANNQFGTSNHDEETVDEIMNTFMGIDRYIKMDNLPYDQIHHIDMHMKIIDEETMIVGEYPEGIADGPQIEANIQYILSNFETVYGRPFNIIRIPMPPENNGSFPNTGGDYRTYANALIANKTIILPTYQEKYDTTAIRIWEEAMPGYSVKGINCNSIIPLSGALHCITKEVSAANPIVINMRKENTWCSDNSFIIEANIESNSPLTKVQLYSRTDQFEEFIAQDMLFQSDNTYNIEVQPLEIGVKLEYYISVENEAGKQISRPLPAELGARVTNIVDCSIVSVAELDQQKINVFPNPATAITCIDLSKISTEVSSIVLIDLLGRKIQSIYSHTSGEAYAQKMFFDASLLDSGTYFLQIAQNGKSIMKKISIH